MDYHLQPYMALAIGVRVLSLTLTSAILVVIFLQIRRDAASRAFAALNGLFAFNALVAIAIRFTALAGGDIAFTLKLIVVAIAALPAFVFIFVLNYLERWTPFRRRLAWAMLVYILVVAVCAGLDWLNFDEHILPEGTLEVGRTPLANVLVGFGQLFLFVVLGVLWWEHRHRKPQSRPYSGRILLGVIVLVIAGVTIAVPPLTRFTIEQFLYAGAIILFAVPVLRNRLFDPLSQLNAQLTRRAEQFTAITQVGQKALAYLKVDPLLHAAVEEIQRAFGCAAVRICLPEAGKLTVRASKGAFPVVGSLSCP